jgi:hypothetical protein
MMAHEETRKATHHIREEYEQAQNTKRTQIAQSKADLLAFQAHLRTILHATHTAVAECLTILSEIPARDTHGTVMAAMTLRRHLPLSCADLPIGTFMMDRTVRMSQLWGECRYCPKFPEKNVQNSKKCTKIKKKCTKIKKNVQN